MALSHIGVTHWPDLAVIAISSDAVALEACPRTSPGKLQVKIAHLLSEGNRHWPRGCRSSLSCAGLA
jgi:hypothetical protein